MANITIIGATSATGTHLIPMLERQGHQLTVLTRAGTTTLASDAALHVVVGSVTATADVARAVDGADTVIMLVGARKGDPVGTIRSDATRVLIDVLRSTNQRPHVIAVSALGGAASIGQLGAVGRFIYRKVVGPDRLAEVDRQEQLLQASGLPVTIVRPPKLDDRPASKPRELSERVRSSAVLHRSDLASYLTQLIGRLPSAVAFRTVVSA